MASEPDPHVGLCSFCVNVRRVRGNGQTVFYLCELALTDRRFRKYPPLPILRCDGFQPAESIANREL